MAERRNRTRQWQYYERRTGAAKERALARLTILQQVEALVDAGMTKTRAVEAIALASGKNPSTIWSWFATVAGVSRHDRLAYLISESRGGGRRVEVDRDLYRAVARDYLRPEGASWAACVRRAMDQRPGHSAGAPHPRTLWRRLRREYGAAEIAMLRGAKMPAWLYARLPANDR